MKKAKFQIKNIHSNSCAVLIEEKLKEQPGIVKVKANYDSEKVVVIYDENKIDESKIKQEIEKAGDYQVEKIKDSEKEEEDISEKTEEGNSSSRSGLSVSISIIIAGLIIAGAILISNRGNTTNKNTAGQIAQLQDLPSQPSNNAQGPLIVDENTAPSIQNFEITKDDHVRGNFNASITLIEFSDFECPFCVRHYPTLNKILNDYKGKIRLVYKHFPLRFHPNAQKAAEASECADEQGKFWEYHDKLFENFQIGYSIENFKKWAKELGLNVNQFNDCLDSGKYAKKVQADSQEGLEKGVNGTPATFVNGQLISGAQPYELFKQIIDELLNQ